MEPLFKFVLHRPAVKIQDDSIIELTQKSNFQIDLAKAIGKKNTRDLLKTVSTEYVKSKSFIKSTSDLKILSKLLLFQAALDQLSNKSNIPSDAIKDAIKDAFGATASTVVKDNDYIEAIKNLKDSIIAIKYLPEQHDKPIEDLTNALRDLEIINLFVSDPNYLQTAAQLKKNRERVLRLPTQAELKSILGQNEEEIKKQKEAEQKKQDEIRKSIQNKAELYGKLQYAIKEIMNIDHTNLETTSQKANKGFLPPKEVRPLNVFMDNVHKLNSLGQLQVLNAKTQIERGVNLQDAFHIKSPIAEKSTPETKPQRQFFTGVDDFKPINMTSTLFKFKTGTEKMLSTSSLNLLKERKLSITEMGIDKVVVKLKFEMEELSSELEISTQSQKINSLSRIGNIIVKTSVPTKSMWGYLPLHQDFNLKDFFMLDDRIPKTKGKASPSGVADLLIVKQQLKSYEGRDVAHIENILKGELKSREHRRFNQTINDTFIETEKIQTEERELESTDRFELSRETSKTIEQEASLKAGLSVSGTYGPTVSFSASAEGSLSTSKEEATKTAATFSKSVTQRSVEKLTERILQSNRIIITTEIEEKNIHELDNKAGTGHISGVYQWVEKVYEAQMYNYGLRMMYDFMLPEPGAYIVESMQTAHASKLMIEKPIDFTLNPNQINETNYNFWIHAYGATGIVPPPEEYITKSLDYSAGGGDDKTDYYHSGIVQIDEGYQAIQASVGAVCNQWSGNRVVDMVVGRRTHRFVEGDWLWITNLNNETESIPLAFKTNDVSDIAVAFEIKCLRTSRAYKKWQLETHGKLMESYKVKLADYEERLAAAELNAGVEIKGKNPTLNLEIMKDELKKNCVAILTNQHFDLFNSIENGINGLPQVNLYENEAEGPYVRFFEQAFEWEHITWLTYPYFWGRKSKWEERIAYDDPDPLFNQFIKAGYCRAVVPVRPGFEGALDHFLTFGEIWNGGPLPAISSDLYLPIADEIAERLDRPGDEIPQGDPWEVRIPTNLVKLRADDSLPTWKKDATGNWIEQ
ncbi:hypothetical protein [Arenibacter echinorum]|uniref:Uncharacterized protein n=1 Tax=Arenibacter echinorum TaxID=440515 RepID=A0A327QTV4_9FLAO|nr:hypothetical protein [Arenibacter echinorum]RAJ08009.1 hypothetical protein LV92_03572 [Arenibacter echinorum]